MERVSGRRKRHNFPSKKKIQEIDLQLTGWLRTHRGLIIFSIKKDSRTRSSRNNKFTTFNVSNAVG